MTLIIHDEMHDWTGRAALIAAAPEMLKLLDELEICGDLHNLGWTCPVCGSTVRKNHKPDCRLAAVLRAAKGEA